MSTTNTLPEAMRKCKLAASKVPADFKSLVQMFPPCAIHDDVAYENTQEIIDALTNLTKRSVGQEKYLETLTILMAKYEEATERIGENIAPLDALRHLMEDHEMNSSDVGRLLGKGRSAQRPSAGTAASIRAASRSSPRISGYRRNCSSELHRLKLTKAPPQSPEATRCYRQD